MIQQLIQERFKVQGSRFKVQGSRFKVHYNVRYISELLKNMGFSFQRPTFVASQRDAETSET